jgi:hypothetical protein
MLPQHHNCPLLAHDVNSGGTGEGGGNGALASSIFSCSCDDNDGNGSVEDSALVLSIVLCLCDNNSGISADNGAFSLLVALCSHEHEGGMMIGNRKASCANISLLY